MLMYACINWAPHVANIRSGEEVTREVWDALYRFFDEKLLQWFECLSLLTLLGDAVSSLQKLEAWTQSEHNLWNAILDARQFTTENFDFVSHYPLETYSSALVWLPELSCIWTKYGDIKKSSVYSVIFSLDGSHVVSGSEDTTVCEWNIATGISTVFADHALLQDHLPSSFHISPPLLLTSIHLDFPWIVHPESGLQCWLPR
ncbi:hypothetical protein L208DRAFT_1496371 [Tricholoma matsutake]|nr:hypothetical protein L208DRAFT_1496371 [Tricholoma matsutake 945]